MGRVRQLGIVFDGNANLFAQGDVIKGQVVVVVDGEKYPGLNNVKGIWVRFQGKAKTKWTTRSNNNTHTHSLKESYFDTYLVAFGTGKYRSDVKGLQVPMGRNSFPFQFQLPLQPLPPPFEGKYGYVRYRAKATVSLIRTFSNKTSKTEKLFSIVGPTVDLNAHHQAQEPVNYSEDIMDCCGCSSTPEMTIRFGLPKQGYVPGESIYLNGHVDNREKEERCVFTTDLIQRITYRSAMHEKEKKHVLASGTLPVACPRGRVTDFALGPLRVPPVPASGLLGCEIIDIQYYVQVEGSGYRCKFDVLIGTIPLRRALQVFTTIATAPPSDTGQEMSERTGEPRVTAPPYEAPPPSYEEAVGVIERIVQERNPEDYFSEGQFVPRYPCFNLTVDMPSADRS